MALEHVEGVRNAVADLVCAFLDGGTLVFQTSADVEVATLTFGNPAFNAAADGIAIAETITQDASATGGVIAKFKACDNSTDTVFTGTVGTVGADIIGTSLTISAADTVSIADGDLTYEAMP